MCEICLCVRHVCFLNMSALAYWVTSCLSWIYYDTSLFFECVLLHVTVSPKYLYTHCLCANLCVLTLSEIVLKFNRATHNAIANRTLVSTDLAMLAQHILIRLSAQPTLPCDNHHSTPTPTNITYSMWPTIIGQWAQHALNKHLRWGKSCHSSDAVNCTEPMRFSEHPKRVKLAVTCNNIVSIRSDVYENYVTQGDVPWNNNKLSDAYTK